MSEQKTYVSKVEKFGKSIAVDMPPELFSQMNWQPGDVLAWAVLPDGTGFVVSKLEVPEGA